MDAPTPPLELTVTKAVLLHLGVWNGVADQEKTTMAYSSIASSLPSNYSSDEDGGPVEDGGLLYDESDPSFEPSIVPESPRYSYDEENEYEEEDDDNDETYIEENSDEQDKEDKEAAVEAMEEEVMAAAFQVEWEAKKRKRVEAAEARGPRSGLPRREGGEEVDSEMAKKRRQVDFDVDTGPANASSMAPAIVGPAPDSLRNSSEGSS
uniref:Uncharacterized protein n=1 Tax=Setaria italica TaxID=4555 RepID=K3Y141_SETIT